jgi:beta-lactamase superfamily II metal-dependent hydrolase
MNNRKTLQRLRLFWVLGILGRSIAPAQPVTVQPWKPGTLDIHQIQTGRGNSAYLIFPDGTTLLIDAGAVPGKPGLEQGLPRPNASRTPGEWIADYIQRFSPRHPATLDYALITHHHDDHMGALETVAKRIPIATVLNREQIEPGRNDQIGHPTKDFEVRNIAANGRIWNTPQVFPPGESPNGNESSAAIRIRYGNFSYFTGGDLPGVLLDEQAPWHDFETPVAKVVGPVDVLVLNHHGWLDTTNLFFLKTLQPAVIIIPAWHATHPDHGVLRRLIHSNADLFITSLLEAPKAIFSYLRDPFKSTEGHILVRVTEGGATYQVIILDDTAETPTVKAVHGPYASRTK